MRDEMSTPGLELLRSPAKRLDINIFFAKVILMNPSSFAKKSPFRHQALDVLDLFWSVGGKDHGAVGRDQDIILDYNAEVFLGDINPGLDGDNDARD